jgi:hypothetical protein
LHAKETVSIGRLPRTLARQKGIGRTQHPKKASEAPSLTNAYAAVPTPRAEFLPSPTAPSHPAAHEVAPPAPKSRRTGRAPVIRDSPVPAATATPQLAQKRQRACSKPHDHAHTRLPACSTSADDQRGAGCSNCNHKGGSISRRCAMPRQGRQAAWLDLAAALGGTRAGPRGRRGPPESLDRR